MIAWDARKDASIAEEIAIITSGLATGAANRQQMMMSSFTWIKDLTIARTVTANYSRNRIKNEITRKERGTYPDKWRAGFLSKQ